MPTHLLHDARTGFFDIKPMTEPGHHWLWLPALLVLLITALIWWLRSRQIQPPPKPPSELEMFQRAALEIKAGSAPAPRKASACSMLIRDFLGKMFLIPGEDLTRLEIKRELERALPRELPRLPLEARNSFLTDTNELLQALERFAFQESAERKDITELLDAGSALAEKCFAWIDGERQRRQSVTETNRHAA